MTVLKDEDLRRNWPTGAQEELLRVVTAREGVADRWRAWQESHDIRMVDVYRLVPALYRRLKEEGVEGGAYLRGVARHCYAAGAFQQRVAAEMAERFASVGIKVMALKGLAISKFLGYAPRHMGDVDLMVPLDRVDEAIDITLAAGWRSDVGYSPEDLKYSVRLSHATGFQREGQHFDLHWHAIHQDPNTDFDNPMWQRSVIKGAFHIPSKTDLLFHTLLHGIRKGSVVLWPADLYSLVTSRPDEEIDWEVLFQVSLNRRLLVQLQVLICALESYVPGSVPEGFRDRVTRYEISAMEIMEHHSITSSDWSKELHRAYKVMLDKRRKPGRLAPVAELDAFFRFGRRPSSV